MDKEIREIVDKYKDSVELKKFSTKYYFNLAYDEPVKTKKDISKITLGIDATLNYYGDFESLSDGDIEVMERRVAEYELAIFNVLDNIDENSDYTAYELQTFIDHINHYYKKLKLLDKKERVLESPLGYNF